MCFYTVFDTELCPVTLVGDENGLQNLHLDTGEGKRTFLLKNEWVRNDEYFTSIKEQILAYIRGELKIFDVQLNMQGTEFQQKVWLQLTKIPYGQTRSYGEIAGLVGNKKSSRAVGMANGKNPVPLVVP